MDHMVTYDSDDDFPFDDAPPTPPGRGTQSAGRPSGDSPEADPDEDWDRVRECGGPRRRKERVLHTRVSEQLSEDIRRAAEDLRVPMSNLVRNVLEEAFGAVERVSDEVGGFLEEVLGETKGARSDLRRLRRRVTRLAREQRRRFSRHRAAHESDAREDDREAEDGDEAFADRVETTMRETPAPPAAPEPSFPDVIGWQPLLANAAASCARCARSLEPGERIFAGATERGLSRTFLCGSCMRSRTGA
jgi:hypothetical protein